jgi:apolipoprotein N-acyltransferase
MNRTKVEILILPIITGILLGLSALPSNLYLLSFCAFIPLFIAAKKALRAKRPLLIFSLQLFISLVIFYLWVGHWILKTADLSFLIGLLIVIPYVLLISPYILLKKSDNKFAFIYFIAAWLSAELIQSHFQLGSPFYNLGNNLGANPKLIQWYEFTGATGGTLWILAVNVALFSLISELKKNKTKWLKTSAVSVSIFLLPTIFSVINYNTYKEKGQLSEVLIIHPSTDCYNVKYQINIYELMDIYLGIMMPQLTEDVDYVLLPESAITNAGWVADLNNNLVFDHFHKQTVNYPNLKLITGAINYEKILDVEKINGYKKMPGIRYSKNYKAWYYTYSTALLVENNTLTQMRAKEGLVPFQEYAPYPLIIPRLSPVGIDFQFSKRDQNQQVFTSGNGQKTAALICYELVYGNLFAKTVRNGAEAFFVLLNEGWYSDPKVPQQFLQLSRIRAIENRRDIAHCSNLGISAFINQRGDIVAKTESKQPGFLKREIKMNRTRTIASAFGNYLGILAIFIAAIIAIRNLFFKENVSGRI